MSGADGKESPSAQRSERYARSASASVADGSPKQNSASKTRPCHARFHAGVAGCPPRYSSSAATDSGNAISMRCGVPFVGIAAPPIPSTDTSTPPRQLLVANCTTSQSNARGANAAPTGAPRSALHGRTSVQSATISTRATAPVGALLNSIGDATPFVPANDTPPRSANAAVQPFVAGWTAESVAPPRVALHSTPKSSARNCATSAACAAAQRMRRGRTRGMEGRIPDLRTCRKTGRSILAAPRLGNVPKAIIKRFELLEALDQIFPYDFLYGVKLE